MFLGLKPIMLCDSVYVIKKKTGDVRKKHFGITLMRYLKNAWI